MAYTIVIEERNNIKKIAICEDGELSEFLLYDQSKVKEGDIYLGKINKKISSANGKASYFVNVGAGDVFINAFERELEDLEAHEGQDIVLQIAQEAHSEKSPRGVRFLQLAGENVVLCPYGESVNVSSKIADEEKRKKLLDLVNSEDSNVGWIVRTHAETASDDEIISEMQLLKKRFNDIITKAKSIKAPAILWSNDFNVVDIVNRKGEDLQKIVVNSHLMENELGKDYPIEYNANPFEEYGIGEQTSQALQKCVKLRNGGRIFIEETKALVAIDVDSGGASAQGGIGKLNNEAAAEIAKQIVLRNLSGKIVIDFAGFSEPKFLNEAIAILERNLKKDASKSRVLGVTKAGSVEILRGRRHPSLRELLTVPCASCQGTGRIEK